MTTFNVTIPDDKTSFFLEFLELIGGKSEEYIQDFELSKEAKEYLIRQNEVPVEDHIPFHESYERIRNKHGL